MYVHECMRLCVVVTMVMVILGTETVEKYD